MKNSITLFLVTAFVLAWFTVGCTQVIESDGLDAGLREQLSQRQKISITASVADSQPETKTARIGQKFYWTIGDQISLFYGQGEDGGSCFTSTQTEDYVTKTIFEGMINVFTGFTEGADEIKFWGIFPYDTGNSCVDGGASVITTVKAEQQSAYDSWGKTQSVCIGRSDGLAMGFYNLCGGIKFCLSQEGIKRITFRGNDNQTIAGRMKVKMDVEGHPVIDQYLDDEKAISLTTDGNFIPISGTDTTWYYLIVPPTVFSNGFTFTLTKEDGQYATNEVTASRTVKRSIFGVMRTPLDKDLEFTSNEPVQFDDANFKAYCVENFDLDGDGEISREEARVITTIHVDTDSISSIKGIEAFINLKHLWCAGLYNAIGQLKSIDVSQNKALTYLNCRDNQLTSLDVSQNTALTELACEHNRLLHLDISNNTRLVRLFCNRNNLLSLDVSQNESLTYISCYNNFLTSLDVSSNTLLDYFECHSNQLETLDVSHNSRLNYLKCVGNPDLAKLYMAENQEIETLNKDDFTEIVRVQVNNDFVVFEDANFKAYCVENFDLDGDGEISMEEARVVTAIEVDTDSISSIKGVETFNNLNYLHCGGNHSVGQLINIDVSQNRALTYLNCRINQLSSLDVSNNTALEYLYCGENQLTSLDVRKNTVLTFLECSFNQLTSLDVSNNTSLEYLDCAANQLASLDVSMNTQLVKLNCGENNLSLLDVSHNSYLKYVFCVNNQLASLIVSNNTALEYLYCGDNQLTSLDVSKNTVLTFLDCGFNQLTSLDVSNNLAIESLNCQYNQLASLDVSKNVALTGLYFAANQLISLDISNNTAIESLNCSYNQLTSLNVSHNFALTNLFCESNQLTILDVSSNAALTWLYCRLNPNLTEIWLKTGQCIQSFEYDSSIATLKYRD